MGDGRQDGDGGGEDNSDEEMFFLVRSGGFLLTCEGEMVRPYMETHSRHWRETHSNTETHGQVA